VLRNSEVRRLAWCFLVITAIFATLGFLISWPSGILVLGAALAFGILFSLFTRARYRNLAQLSAQIDQILHHEELLSFGDHDEGELSILRSEIQKMTVRIKEQNQALSKEKDYLADALADIAHQLRTPLTSANLALSLAARASDSTEREVYLREAAQLLIRMDWLITALLKLSRLDAGVVEFVQEPVSVDALVRSALEPLLIPMELREVTCQLEIPADAVVIGDQRWLAEALQNILKNCLESVGEHGTIWITCNATPLFTELVIRDSGPGIDPADLPHVFDRFYQGAGRATAGYGIGLALAKMVVTRHGGAIKATNHQAGGAVFDLRFYPGDGSFTLPSRSSNVRSIA